MQHNSNDNNTNDVMIAKGFDTYTIEYSFEENEEGDNIPVTSMYKQNYKHKHRIAFNEKEERFFTKDFCKELITLMTNIGVFDKDQQELSLVAFTSLKKGGFTFRCTESLFQFQRTVIP